VRRGEAVSDPRDAELAAEVAVRIQGLGRIGRWYRRKWVAILHVIALAGAAYWIVIGEWWIGLLLAAALIYPYLLFRFFDRLAANASTAEQKNRALAGTSATQKT
jgi:hypothetical protein